MQKIKKAERISQNGDYFEAISLTVFLGSVRKNCKIGK